MKTILSISISIVGIIIFYIIRQYKISKREKAKEKAEQSKEKLFLEGILKEEEFLEVFIPQLFNGLTSVNVIFTGKDEGYRTHQILYPSVTKTTADNQRFEESAKTFLGQSLSEKIDMSLPTFLFIQIGKYCMDHGNGIGKFLREFKSKNPKVLIHVCCSNFYWKEKCEGIEALITEGVLEAQKLDDFFVFFRMPDKAIPEIQKCLKEN